MLDVETRVEIGLALALELLGRASVSGIVTVRAEERQAQFVLIDGKVLHATSTNTAKFGESLVERGLINNHVLENALRHQSRKKVKQPLGTILHELGIISKTVAAAELETQIARILHEVFSWKDCRILMEPLRPDAEADVDDVLSDDAAPLDELVARLKFATTDTSPHH